MLFKKLFHSHILGCGGLALSVGLTGCALTSSSVPNAKKAATAATINGLTLRYDFIEDDEYNRRYKMPGPFPDVTSVTIHNTAEPLSAQQERDRVANNRSKRWVSFHFAVDEKEAVQLLPLNRHGWHAGDGGKGLGNSQSIGIEICRSQCYGKDEALYKQAEANAVILAAWLLDTYNLPLDALKKHQDWSGKWCPHRILDEQYWEQFKARVGAAMRSKKIPSSERNYANMAVILHNGKDKQTRFETVTGEEFNSLEALIAALKARGVTTLDISSWVEGKTPEEQRKEFLEPLKAAGFKVTKYYAYHPGASIYEREDLVQSSNDKESFKRYVNRPEKKVKQKK